MSGNGTGPPYDCRGSRLPRNHLKILGRPDSLFPKNKQKPTDPYPLQAAALFSCGFENVSQREKIGYCWGMSPAAALRLRRTANVTPTSLQSFLATISKLWACPTLYLQGRKPPRTRYGAGIHGTLPSSGGATESCWFEIVANWSGQRPRGK